MPTSRTTSPSPRTDVEPDEVVRPKRVLLEDMCEKTYHADCKSVKWGQVSTINT